MNWHFLFGLFDRNSVCWSTEKKNYKLQIKETRYDVLIIIEILFQFERTRPAIFPFPVFALSLR